MPFKIQNKVFFITILLISLFKVRPISVYSASGSVKKSTKSSKSKNYSRYKNIEINGLEVFSQQYLISALKLNRIKKRSNRFYTVASRINKFYRKRGYSLVKTYKVSETRSNLTIFVDEGQLGQIRFRKLSTMKVLEMRYNLHLPGKIFNKYILKKSLKKMKKEYDFKEVKYRLIKSEFYQQKAFQLDSQFEIPYVGKTRLPFFDKYGYRYNLDITFLKKKSKKKEEGFDFKLKTSYSKGLRPFLKFTERDFISEKDRLELYASIGLFYLIDLKPENPPIWTYMEAGTKYYFTPIFKKFFTPRTSALVYRSRASRKDIGLSAYEYLKIRGIIEPGITFSKEFRIYSGIGAEKVFIYKSEIDDEADFIVDIDENTESWSFLQLSIETKSILSWITGLKSHKSYCKTTFGSYVNKHNERFYRADVEGEFKYEISENLTYYTEAEGGKIWNNSPFHHEFSVSGYTFKGFMGQGYHSREIIKSTHGLRSSFYKEYCFAGIYSDFIYFMGSGYDLHDRQFGIAYGISAHIIFLDQFQFSAYFGKDFLFSKMVSQNNLYFQFHRRW